MALLDSIMVIAVLDVGGPIWVVVGVGILVAGLGQLTIRRLNSRLTLA